MKYTTSHEPSWQLLHNFATPPFSSRFYLPLKEALGLKYAPPRKSLPAHLENFEFEIARQFVNQTGSHIFLTGKAGTGKTTFLREVVGKTTKKCVVVAPTGVAAINAGGVTIHSMFGLPTKSYIPSNQPVDPNLANNQITMTPHFHYNRQKLEVIQELELLVIDEVSMVRADLLDAVDFALRYARKNPLPFGGVQVLFIGDMYQLPPVVKDDEWVLLSNFYSAPFFFNSTAFQKLDPVYIELKKIYRQSDRQFINILNNIRHQDFQQEDYEVLKELYQPDFEANEPGFITLTTHNKKAESINEIELAKLPDEEVIFDAAVEGDFGDNMFPTERLLRLRKGAQVMFVKNDTSGERKYFNGKIGIVESINPYAEEGEELSVRFPDTDEVIYVKKELWENIRYSVNSEDSKIEQNRIGSFSQYPLRLAWAITIHKSQGLTFEKAVIDAGDSFSAGQVYVALSRCTSMDHLVLKSMITSRSILSDPRIVEFSDRIMKEKVLEDKLFEAEKQFAFQQLLKIFDFAALRTAVYHWDRTVAKLKSVNRAETFQRTNKWYKIIDDLQSIAKKFHSQLQVIFDSDGTIEDKMQQLHERCHKAIGYFVEQIETLLVQELADHLKFVKNKSKLKKYTTETVKIWDGILFKKKQLYECQIDGKQVYDGEIPVSDFENKKAGKIAGSTYDITLELYREGHSFEKIAEIRTLALGTVETHIARWITKNEIKIADIMEQPKIDMIAAVLKKLGIGKATEVKSELGPKASFGEIRMVMAALASEQI